MLCSIVVTSYKRPHLVGRAVRSALDFCKTLDDGEVIVVDDASFDETFTRLQAEFPAEIAAQKLRLTQHETNLGVTASKNTGFKLAHGTWVIFLDSDDVLLPENAEAFRDAAKRYGYCPILFFKCKTPEGLWVGDVYDKPFLMSIKRFLRDGHYGELLTIIRRDTATAPYDADLRGFEILGCLRIIRTHGPGMVLPTALRIYYTEHGQRLSTRHAMLKRGNRLARGHARTLFEFWNDIDWILRLKIMTKIGYHLARGTYGRLLPETYS